MKPKIDYRLRRHRLRCYPGRFRPGLMGAIQAVKRRERRNGGFTAPDLIKAFVEDAHDPKMQCCIFGPSEARVIASEIVKLRRLAYPRRFQSVRGV